MFSLSDTHLNYTILVIYQIRKRTPGASSRTDESIFQLTGFQLNVNHLTNMSQDINNREDGRHNKGAPKPTLNHSFHTERVQSLIISPALLKSQHIRTRMKVFTHICMHSVCVCVCVCVCVSVSVCALARVNALESGCNECTYLGWRINVSFREVKGKSFEHGLSYGLWIRDVK